MATRRSSLLFILIRFLVIVVAHVFIEHMEQSFQDLLQLDVDGICILLIPHL